MLPLVLGSQNRVTMIQGGCTRRQAGLTPKVGGEPSLGISRSRLQQRGLVYGGKGLLRRDVTTHVAEVDTATLFPAFYDSEKEQSRKYRRSVSLFLFDKQLLGAC